jgi:hypothetical protein
VYHGGARVVLRGGRSGAAFKRREDLAPSLDGRVLLDSSETGSLRTTFTPGDGKYAI